MNPSWWALLCSLAMLGPSQASAHTRSQSQTSWIVDGRVVTVAVSIPEIEVRRISPGVSEIPDESVLAYLRSRIGVADHGITCPSAAVSRMVAAASGYRRAEFAFDCPDADDTTLRFAAFFDLVSSHVDIAQIQLGNGDFVEQLFTDHAQYLSVKTSKGEELKDASFLRFVQMGIMHIFTGIDHMSFLLGLVLISRRLRDLIFVITGFTLGHSLTLALAVTGILRPHAEFIDALVALTIALIGIENIVVSVKHPNRIAVACGGLLLSMAGLSLAGFGVLPPLLLLGAGIFTCSYLMISGHLQDAGRLRLVVTMVFGLIHGFGFASDLLESHLPKQKLAEILVGFNLGVEMGQLAVVLLVIGFVISLRRAKLSLPRPITVDVTASSLIALGMFWFIQRSFA